MESGFVRSAMWALVKINTRERLILFAIFLNQFNYWPSFEFAGLGGFSFEIAMISGLVLFLNGYSEFKMALVPKLFSMRKYLLLYVWLAYGAILGAVMSDEPEVIIVKSLYLGSVMLGAQVVALMHRENVIDFENILKGWVGVAMLMVPLYIAQYVLAALGVDWVSKRAYRVGVFEFPRLHGFSFEPLFLANWLLVPTLYSLTKPKLQRKVAFVLSFVLLLTLARGAVIALVLALLLYALLRKVRLEGLRNIFRPLTSALVLILLVTGLSAQFNGSTFLQGSFRYMDHLTLGLFNSGGASNVGYLEVGPDGREIINTREIDRQGVVEASTVSRVDAIKLGFEIYEEQPITGVGMFRLGEEANALYPEVYQDESLVTNAQPVDTLVETGLIGTGLLALVFMTSLKVIFRKSILVVMLAALVVQMLFFTNLFLLPFWLVLASVLATKPPKGLRIG